MDGTLRSAKWVRAAFVIGAACAGVAFAACGGDDSSATNGGSDASVDTGGSSGASSSSGSSGASSSSGSSGASSSSGADGSSNDANDGQAPGTIATVTDQIGTSPRHIATDGINVYWTDEVPSDAGAGGNVGRVMKIPVGGGTATQIAQYPADLSTGWVGVDSTSVYWAVNGQTAADRGIWKAPVGGGAPQQIYGPTNYVSGLPADIAAVALGTTNLAFKLATSVIVASVPIGGGTGGDLTPDLQKAMPQSTSIGADGTYAYWQTGGSSAINGVIRRAAFGSDAGPTDIVSPDDGGIDEYVTSIGDLVVNGGNLYWANNQWDIVFKVPVAGGKPTALANGPKAGNVAHLAVDGTNVYWLPSPYNPGIVVKVPVAGGTLTTLATGAQMNNSLSPIAVDGTNVYWFNPPYLFKTPK